MMRVIAFAAVVLLLTSIALKSAQATQVCAAMYDKFSAQTNEVAEAYKKMKSAREVCEYGRNTDLPLQREILAQVRAMYRSCDSGVRGLNMAKQNLQETTAHVKKVCRDAGM